MPESDRSSPLTFSPEEEKRGCLYFVPRSGVHSSWLAAHLTGLTIASFLTILYVWVDEPGPSDAGKHTLSGLLVAIFGPRWAIAGGMVLLSVLSLVLLRTLIGYLRWITGRRPETRLRRKASRT